MPIFFFLLSIVTVAFDFNRLSLIPDWVSGSVYQLVIDKEKGLLVFNRGWSSWAIWESKTLHDWKLVYSTPYDSGVKFDSSFFPIDCGDIDKDGKSDLIGTFCKVEWNGNHGYPFEGLAILESKDTYSYPTDRVYLDTTFHASPVKIVDLDNDGEEEIFCLSHAPLAVPPNGFVIYESQGDNLYVPVYHEKVSLFEDGCTYPVFGDFDKDGKIEFLFCWFDSTIVYKCINKKNYQVVWSDYHWRINTHDNWVGNDTDGDGWPEIFVENHWFGPQSGVALTMYEATGVNTYKVVEIDTIWRGINFMEGSSTCGDVDGDGRQEVIFSIGGEVFVYKATGPDQYEQVWDWRNDMGRSAVCRCADLNKNGYDEIYISGDNKTSVFEINKASIPENVRIKHPIVASLSVKPTIIRNSGEIKYSVPKDSRIELTVYDATGRKVVKLLSNELKAGSYTTTVTGRDLPAGAYFVRLESPSAAATARFIVIQ